MSTKKKKKSIFKRVLKYTFRAIGIVILFFLTWSLMPLKQTTKTIEPRPDTRYWSMQDGYKYDQGEYSSVHEYVDLLKGEYKFIENAGHIIWWDKPNEYNQTILNFLTEETTKR